MALANIVSYGYADRASGAPNSNGIFFSKYLERSTGGVTDPFENFIGADGQMGTPIVRNTDLEKGGGDLVYFTKNAALRKSGSRGEVAVVGAEEKMRYGTDSVKVDFVRHGTGFTKKDLMKAATGGSIPIQAAKELEKWLSGMRTEFILQRLRGRAQLGVNVYYAGGRGSLAALTSSDVFTTSSIEGATGLLGDLMAAPINGAKSKRGAVIQNFLFFGPNTVLRGLYSDSVYTAQSSYAQNRGDGNTLIQGGLSDWRGNGIFNWNAGDEDGDGPVGSFFNPKAILGNAAIAAGTTALTINGGGSGYTSGTDYFRHFPGNTAFTQYQGESITENVTPAASDYYLKIINHVESSSGAGDQGKWGFYRFTGTSNTGAVITTKAETGNASTGAGGRLGAAVSGHTTTTLGGVTYSSTVNTEAHPVGASIYLANRLGNIIGFVGAMGSNAVRIAYGSNEDSAGRKKGTSITGSKYDDSQDAGMQIAAYIEAVMGVDVKLDTLGRPRGFVLIPTVYLPNQIATA